MTAAEVISQQGIAKGFVFLLLACGFGVASRKTTGSALWGVLVPFALIVLVKVGFSLIF